MKRALRIVVPIAAAVLAAAGLLWWAYFRMMSVTAVVVDPGLTVYLGGGGNSLVLTSEDGSTALVVDTKLFAAARFQKTRVQAREVIVVNTHYHLDHVQGNRLYPAARLVAGALPREQWRSLAGGSPYPDTVVAPGEEITFRIGGETVRVANLGRAHGLNDTVVYFESRKLLAAGDLLFAGRHPAFIDPAWELPAWIAGLEELARRYDADIVVPGHGEIADEGAIAAQKEYFLSIAAAVDSREELRALREKYRHYAAIPLASGFRRTVRAIRSRGGARP